MGQDMTRDVPVRILAGLIAVLMAGAGFAVWFALDQAAPLLGLSPDPLLARSSIRADNGTLFLTLAGLAGYAALIRHRMAAMFCATMFLIACAGRGLTLLLDGYGWEILPPMLLEGAGAAILFVAARMWTHA